MRKGRKGLVAATLQQKSTAEEQKRKRNVGCLNTHAVARRRARVESHAAVVSTRSTTCEAQAAGSTRTTGRAAADVLRSLNHALKGALGVTLMTFRAPTPRPSVLHMLPPDQVPEDGFKVFLNLLPDQGAPGLLAIRHLYSTVGIFGVPQWDPLHRQWNDGKLGIQKAGLWGPPPSSSPFARGS